MTEITRQVKNALLTLLRTTLILLTLISSFTVIFFSVSRWPEVTVGVMALMLIVPIIGLHIIDVWERTRNQ